MKNTEYEKTDFPVVGIGASAGGLAAYELFFSSLPKTLDIDISFVLIQHLSPDSHSMLSEIIKKYTNMEVFEVKENMKIEPGCVYIIPPNYDMKLSKYMFKLIKHSKDRTQRLPIDFFFNSLAQELHKNSVAIILSGTGCDGSKGIKSIKGKGGLVFVQKTQTAQYEGMPKCALDTGFVDYELNIEDMWTKLISCINNIDSPDITSNNINEDHLKSIFTLLKRHTGHDFSMYKSNTMNRRIEKAMQIHKIATLKEYVKFLSKNKNEILELLDELLIGVTSFFRDKDAFESFEKNVIPKLFTDKNSDSSVRVWTAGCSTGEEAYSIAILLKEYMDKQNFNNPVQIFASDIDPKAIAAARNRVFPNSIEDELTQSRLKRFFHKKGDGYVIDKTIRDMIIFSEHDIIKDPPFSKLDLLSCRNVLIYMNTELQKKIISQFHYALYPNGILFLGSSESVGDMGSFFNSLDQKNKIFQCNSGINTTYKMTTHSVNSINYEDSQLLNKTDTLPVQLKPPVKDIAEQAVIKHFDATAVLVDELGDILYFLGETSKFLTIPQGESSINNIYNMLKEEIKGNVLKALNSIKVDRQDVKIENLTIKNNMVFDKVNITISSVLGSYHFESPKFLYIIIFEDVKSPKDEVSNNISTKTKNADESTTIKELQEKLKRQEKFLQDANERLMFSNQELKSYNEEIQSMNEELQSTNEELETSREELQSANEELSVVNSELQAKVSDLTTVNNDMNNLISGTGIGTIFVDHNLNILRFTPTIKQIMNLIPGDTGRFLGDIASNMIGYKELIDDTKSVLDTLIPKEIEIQTKSDLWFLMRIQPYRTLENVIEGAVVTFIDITEIVKMRQELKKR